jgi:hypothetical protein
MDHAVTVHLGYVEGAPLEAAAAGVGVTESGVELNPFDLSQALFPYDSVYFLVFASYAID